MIPDTIIDNEMELVLFNDEKSERCMCFKVKRSFTSKGMCSEDIFDVMR